MIHLLLNLLAAIGAAACIVCPLCAVAFIIILCLPGAVGDEPEGGER